jgi:5-methylcytosine-specific restriction endonuclease McrA
MLINHHIILMEILKMKLNFIQDNQLINLLKNKVKEEQKINLEVIELLREVQRRRLFSDFGHANILEFCIRELNYSEHQAYRRLRALKTIRDIPETMNHLKQGDLNLTTLNQLGQFVSVNKDKLKENQIVNLLEELKGQSKNQTHKILKNKSEEFNLKMPDCHSPQKYSQSENDSGELRIHLTLSLEEKELLKKVQGLLGHSKNNKNTNEKSVILLGLELLKENLEKKKFAVTKRKLNSPDNKSATQEPKKNPPPKNTDAPEAEIKPNQNSSRMISASVKREVYQKAEGKCVICHSYHALEIDHVIAFSIGGTHHDSENLRLLCKNCNQRAAIKTFGQEQMDLFINA